MIRTWVYSFGTVWGTALAVLATVLGYGFGTVISVLGYGLRYGLGTVWLRFVRLCAVLYGLVRLFPYLDGNWVRSGVRLWPYLGPYLRSGPSADHPPLRKFRFVDMPGCESGPLVSIVCSI